MTEAFADPEPGGSTLDVLPGPFEVDRAERIEALTTSARGPLRLAASALVRLDARLGRWRKQAAPVSAGAEVARPEPAVRTATAAAPGSRTGNAPAAEDAPSWTVPAGTDLPTGTEPPAGAEPAGTEPAGTEPAGTEPAGAEPTDTPAGTDLPAGTDTPAGLPVDPVLAPVPAPPAGDAFPDRLAGLAGLHAAGVCEDDAWERWAAGEGEDHLAALDELDRPDGRLTRIGARLGGSRRGPEHTSGHRGSRRAAAGVS